QNLSDIGWQPCIRGLRLPDLCRFLLIQPDDPEIPSAALVSVLEGLRSLLAHPVGEDAGFLSAIRDDPGEMAHWHAYSDWLMERGRPVAGLHLLELALRLETPSWWREHRDPARDLVKVGKHAAQACKHQGLSPETHTYEQWIFVDDRWLAAHPI